MRKVFFTSMILLVTIFTFTNVHASERVVRTKSTSSGVYEDGKFTEKEDSFEAVYAVDEARDKIVLTKIVSNNREGKYREGDVYEITNTLESEGPSALLVSRDKKGQEILTAVRDSGLGASETMILGEDFYQYSKAENGKFYLEYGSVTENTRY